MRCNSYIKILFFRGQMFTPLVPVLKILICKTMLKKVKPFLLELGSVPLLRSTNYASSHYLALLSTLPDKRRDSRFWTVSPSLSPKFTICCTLDFPTYRNILDIWRYFSYTTNMERFLINSSMPL